MFKSQASKTKHSAAARAGPRQIDVTVVKMPTNFHLIPCLCVVNIGAGGGEVRWGIISGGGGTRPTYFMPPY